MPRPSRRIPRLLASLSFVLSCATLPETAVSQATRTLEDESSRALDLSAYRWRYVGPAIAGGRITDLEVVPGDPSHLFVGAASGGVFESLNHGVTWKPIFDEMPNLSVGDIALAPSDPLEIWVGTGEANNRNSSPWGAGLFHSTDGGKTWRFAGLKETKHIARVLVHPTDPSTVWVAAVGHLWGPNPERGIYKTTDGGETWRKVLYVDEDTGVGDLALNPADPEVLYAATYPRRRRAWGFVGGGPTGGIWRSTDGGETWEEVTAGLPSDDIGRIGFETWARDPNLVMAIVEAEDGGIFRSTDRGQSWTKVNDLNPRPMYYSQIRLDPNDSERIYVLGTYLHRSVDGGETFVELPLEVEYNTGVHVDHHDLWIDPRNSRHMILGNDGGLYFTFDGGDNWHFTANLPIQQLYDVSLDMEDPYRIYGGLQDNNSYRGPSATRRYHGILNHDWLVVDYGDGMTSQADPSDPTTAYVSSQGGGIVRLDSRTLDRKDLQPFNPDTADAYRFYWTAPILLSPHDPSTVYLGGNRLFISRDRGVHWEATDDLTKAVPQDSLEVMGVLPDSTTLSRNDGVGSYGQITSIAESGVAPGVLWVGTDDGTVQVSRDGGESWVDVSDNIGGLPHPMFVSRVEASWAVEGRAYVAFDGHWDDDYSPYLFVTEDFGASWRSIAEGLDASTVNAVREHPRNPDLLFVGAEDGVFVSMDRGGSWPRLNNNMPRVPVDDIEIHPRENDVVAGTHGRGIWILDDVSALSGLTREVRSKAGHLFSPVPATLFQYKTDVPSQGQGILRAENPPFGATLDYWLRATQDGGVTIRVRGADGELMRTMEGPGSAGLNRVVWDLRHQPVPHDTSVFQPPNLDAGPRGPLVMPGEFEVALSTASGDDPSSVLATTHLEVRWDPLMPLPESEIRARYEFTLALYEMQQIGYHAQVQAAKLLERARISVDSLKALEDETPVVLADSLLSVMEDALSEIRTRNSDLRGWWRGLIGEFDGGPSVIGSMTGPTAAQEARLAWTRAQFAEAVDDLDAILRETAPELTRILEEAGVPPFELPERGEGPAAYR
jgi:photosystem II stability/assembly factor-like uncharacterized protein